MSDNITLVYRPNQRRRQMLRDLLRELGVDADSHAKSIGVLEPLLQSKYALRLVVHLLSLKRHSESESNLTPLYPRKKLLPLLERHTSRVLDNVSVFLTALLALVVILLLLAWAIAGLSYAWKFL